MKINNFLIISIFLVLIPFLVTSIKIKKEKDGPILVQGIQAPLGPNLSNMYQQRNLRTNPLDQLTPITIGGNKAEENPLISEGNREMIKDFSKGTNNFSELPILANNQINTQALRNMNAQPGVVYSQTINPTPSIATSNVVVQPANYITPTIISTSI